MVTVGLAVCDGSGLGNGVVVGVGEEVVLGSTVGVGEGLSTTGLVEGLALGSGEIVAVVESEVATGEGTGSGD